MKKKTSLDGIYDWNELFDPFGITGINIDSISAEMPMGGQRTQNKESARHRRRAEKFLSARYVQVDSGEAPLDSVEAYNFSQGKDFVGRYSY